MQSAQDWAEVGEIIAAGTSEQEARYDFSDRTAQTGHNYYRLRMTDTDGASTYSPTVHALFRPLGPLVFPNPATTSFWVRAGSAGVLVMDAMGRSVPHHVARVRGDASEVSLPVGTVGVFTVLIGEGDLRHAERVVLR